MKELNLHEYYLDDAIDTILDTVEECSAVGVCELMLVHGYSHGNLIKKWIWSGSLAAELRKVHVQLTGRVPVQKNQGATLIRFSAIE